MKNTIVCVAGLLCGVGPVAAESVTPETFLTGCGHAPTWEYRGSAISLRRRMDHIVYSPELHCCSARVLRAGASDHFPVEAVFAKQDPPR